ncbi:MAG: gliding motility-associated C-terminal domain-containing protein, partial [Bacteroidota bacterium]
QEWVFQKWDFAHQIGLGLPLPGDYLVELKVSNNCQEDSLEQIISIQGPELITIDTTVCNGTEFVFNGVLQTESGTFYDTLLTQEGCLSVTETNLTFEGCVCELQFPNAFTPNGDGNNDTFGPATEDCMPTVQNYQISIFSRWGDLVFESRNVDDAWDGMELGEALPSDVYVWFAQYEELGADGEFEQLKAKGDITLIR